MKLAETVTFGTSGLDRAAELRGDAAALADLRADRATRAVVFWRGKPLVTGDQEDHVALARVALDHPLLADSRGTDIFLGRDEGGAVFAADLSAWEPETYDAEAMGTFLDPTEQRHPALDGDERFAELRAIMTQLSRRDAEIAASAKAVMGWHDSHGFCAKCGERSDVVMAGWQRDCPACGAHHFPRTDPVVIMLITHEDSVLVGRSPGWPEGMYSLLAGFIEPGETIEAAVRREVFEEAGVRVGEVDYLSSQPWPFPASLMFGCSGRALSREITIDPTEIEDARWMSRADMVKVFAGNHPLMKPARKGAIAHFLLSNWLADQLD